MAHRFAGIATAAVLQLAALVLAHELVFVVRYGSRFGEALVHSGHGEAWTVAVIACVVLTAGVAAMGVARLFLLGLRVRRTAGAFGASRPPTLERGALLRAWLRLAPRMAILSVALLVSFVAALFAWRHRVLLAHLRAARARMPRVGISVRARPRTHLTQPAGSLLGRGLALRAPPASIAA